MRRKIIALSLVLFGTLSLHAQSFLDHLQKEDQEQGQGSVSVKQSDDISNLVNGNRKKESDAKPGTSSSQSSSATSRPESRPAPRESSASSATGSSTSSDPSAARREREQERDLQRREDAKIKEEARKEAMKPREDYSSSGTATSASHTTVKKVMRGGSRINGYMVQVWSGGNTREDKVKAEQVGQEMKAFMPNLPVYVHFYSPRWACRIGNFKKQEEASDLVKKLKKKGYRSACVVKASLITRTNN